MSKEVIFIVDDDKEFSEFTAEVLAPLGEIQTFQNSKDFLEALKKHRPSLVLIDFNLNHKDFDGFDLVKEVHKRHDSHLIPMLMVSGADDIYSKALHTGIDDYIQKPILPDLFFNKVKHTLYQSRKKIYTNALTGLPDIHMVEWEYLSRIRKKDSFSLAYLDIDNFKSFNDCKGVKAGDEAIKIVAKACFEVRSNFSTEELFIGHLGGDDFFLVGNPNKMPEIIQNIYSQFNKKIRYLFTQEEWSQKCYHGFDREGRHIEVTLLSISTAIIRFNHQSGMARSTSFQEITEKAAALKKQAKKEKGNSIVEKKYEEWLSPQRPSAF